MGFWRCVLEGWGTKRDNKKSSYYIDIFQFQLTCGKLLIMETWKTGEKRKNIRQRVNKNFLQPTDEGMVRKWEDREMENWHQFSVNFATLHSIKVEFVFSSLFVSAKKMKSRWTLGKKISSNCSNTVTFDMFTSWKINSYTNHHSKVFEQSAKTNGSKA